MAAVAGSSTAATSAATATDTINGNQPPVAEAQPTPTMVYQLKVSLARFRPPLWRRIQVPSTWTFFDLHKAIQVVMPWSGTHCHEFVLPMEKKTDPDFLGGRFPITIRTSIRGKRMISNEFPDHVHLDEKTELIANHFALVPGKNKIDYAYDFGSTWDHIVVLEKILPAVKGKKYPVCIAGRRLCPPEDPTEEEEIEYEAGLDTEPKFNPKDVNFDAMKDVLDFDA